MTNEITRRAALAAAASTAGALALGMNLPSEADEKGSGLKGRLKQSACRWCYSGFSLEDLCVKGKEIGLVGIDLLGENEWATVKQHGLVCTMAMGLGTIADGWNHTENHSALIKEAERLIPLVAKAGLPNLITFSGNRKGMADDVGLRNCAAGVKHIVKIAEDHGVTVCMELLNSKRSHPDYMCDHTNWGVELCKEVASPRFRLLYDIFHMQIMEGDLCDTIKENIEYIAHFHTGGVPGRHEIDSGQEINYRRVCEAIVATEFKGFVAHEFVPTRDPMSSLREAVRLCDV